MTDNMQEQLRQIHAATVGSSDKSIRREGGSREKRLIDAILVIAVGALAGALWTLNATVATLNGVTSQHEKRLDTLEGKTFRGVDGYENAPNKQ